MQFHPHIQGVKQLLRHLLHELGGVADVFVFGAATGCA